MKERSGRVLPSTNRRFLRAGTCFRQRCDRTDPNPSWCPTCRRTSTTALGSAATMSCTDCQRWSRTVAHCTLEAWKKWPRGMWSHICRHWPNAERPLWNRDNVANTGQIETRPADNWQSDGLWNLIPCTDSCLRRSERKLLNGPSMGVESFHLLPACSQSPFVT